MNLFSATLWIILCCFKAVFVNPWVAKEIHESTY